MATDVSKRALISRRVLSPEGLRHAAVLIEDGKILKLEDPARAPPDFAVEDLGDLVIAPGLVDTHVHVNEPGRTAWEGYQTATRSAAAGGITTLIDMPLNSSPVTTTLAALETKRESAEGQLWIDVGFWGGVVPGNTKELRPMAKAGLFGFKCFLVHSGIDDFPNVTAGDLDHAMPELEKAGVPLLVHAELCNPEDPSLETGDPRSYASYLASRPDSWEVAALELVIEKVRKHRTSTHIVHLSSAKTLPLVRRAREDRLPFSVETCPHYLAIRAEDVPEGDTRFKCAPPIREGTNQDRLWDALREGLVDFVVSDHSPCVPELKKLESGDFFKAWGGISSLQFGLSILWAEAERRHFDMAAMWSWLSERPARRMGLTAKGRLAAGYDADLVVFDPEASYVVDRQQVLHRNKLTPYEGRTLRGVVRRTLVRGREVQRDGVFEKSPAGRMLKGPAA